jgi:uncharacterized protein YyaL (SSP411 family)
MGKLVFAWMAVLLLACTTKGHKEKKSNDLLFESSPYLLSHAYNPVDWKPWAEKWMEVAKKEDKLLLISIGYSSCHWCHVMERESFSDTAVASLMNQNYLNIKVDREERPDIDNLYMEAASLLSENVGWPLNVIALNDGTPIYATSYIPKDEWLVVLERLADLYQNDKERLLKQAQAVRKGIQTSALLETKEKPSWNEKTLVQAAQKWKSDFDKIFGGYNQDQKFPFPSHWAAWLDYCIATSDSMDVKYLTLTLDRMAKGGIYDHLGGGFSRYSTDRAWRVPHFEKMLCDNAQLLSLYSKAYRFINKDLYKKTLQETATFLLTELYNEKGGFFASIDAETQGEEGAYYLWQKSEIEAVLSENAKDFMLAYGVKEQQNNILQLSWQIPKELQDKGLNEDSLFLKFEPQRKVLLAQRGKRVAPAKDIKILTSWNALTIKGFTDAYLATQNKTYLKVAQNTAQFLLSELREPDGRLYHCLTGQKRSVNGFLEDYACLIDALVYLYQADFNENWLLSAKELTRYVFNHFENNQSPLFFYTSELDAALFSRRFEVSDQVLPSSNALMAKNLLLLGTLFFNESWVAHAQAMSEKMLEATLESPSAYPVWFNLLQMRILPMYEMAIVGKNWSEVRLSVSQQLSACNVLFMGGGQDGSLELLQNKFVEDKTIIYLCINKLCKKPTEDLREAIAQIKFKL